MENTRFTQSIFMIVILVLILLNVHQCKSHKEELQSQSNLHEAILNDSLVKYIDEKDRLVVTSAILRADNIAMFAMIESRDTTIKRLQGLVQDYKKKLKKGSSATVIGTTGSVSGSTTDIVVTPDKDCPDANPTYKADYNFNGWVWGEVIANKDSVGISVRYRDEFDVVIGEESQGWFKKNKPFAQIRSHNPYTDVTEFRTFQVIDNTKPKRFSIGPTINYGIQDGLSTGFSMGIGITYGIIRF